MTQPMSIIVNGKTKRWIENETLTELLKRIKYTYPLMVVKINDQLIRKQDFDSTHIPNNASITIIHLASGG